MSTNNLSRRHFLQTAFYSSLVYGAGALPSLAPNAHAMPVPLTNRILIDLFLDGGPDMRHLVVPAFDATPNSFGDKYWSNRSRSHSLAITGQTAQQRWNDDYYPITVGGNNWSGGLVDAGGLNSGVTFGIWREAGWLIDMFRSGNVALIFNAVGGTNRAHDLSSLMMHQGDVLTSLNNQDRSGWGGRLARSAGGNPIALTSSPSPFTFGPVGNAPNFSLNGIDNSDLIVVDNSREIGLYDPGADTYPYNDFNDKMARSAKSYYAALRKEQISNAYQKFMNHEFKTRQFGEAIVQRIDSTPIPDIIQALYSNVIGINPDPNDPATGRRVLRRADLGRQIRNCYDMIAWNDVSVTVGNETLSLAPRVLSMRYGSWDSHSSQRQIPDGFASDPNDPNLNRGIENGFRDIFGGQFGGSPSNSSALHGAFSALWASLGSVDRNQIAITIAGEFGRQIRDNGDSGTDHGKGNLMFVIGERCAGGVYGAMFPQDEIIKYDEAPNRTPDITPRTEIDQFFAQVCDWVQPGSSAAVFQRLSPGYSGDAPLIETPGMFNNLLV
ncbi:MAG: hypothetical protein ACI9WC_002166 [Arenicella sp.]|jgi:uncharacterized protein (DUF1501 family)